MRYLDDDLNFSFQLPEGWRKQEHTLIRTFTSGGCHLYIQVGDLASPEFADADERGRYLMEPGCTCIRNRQLGDEENTVIVDHQSRGDGVISAYRDGLLYSVSYDPLSDPSLRNAIELVLSSFRFPSPEKSQAAMRDAYADPANVALSEMLRQRSPEELRERLGRAGMPAVIQRPGYSMHAIGSGVNVRATSKGKRWWQFWKT